MANEPNKDKTLDPKDWTKVRNLAHQMVDDMMDYLQNIKEDVCWKPVPQRVKEHFEESLPVEGIDIQDIYEDFKTNILPYPKGNIHPRFWAFVQGTGSPLAMMADMLASGMNSNVAIGEHSAMYVDQQVINWCKEMMNYPADASGILVSGGSIANITALNVARNHQTSFEARYKGLKKLDKQLTMYCSTETHSCMVKGAEVIGVGSDYLRRIEVNSDLTINLEKLELAIEEDIRNGFQPICIVGNAGTVNTGAIDDLMALSDLAKKYTLWFHIDGAFGALAKLVPAYETALKGIELCDSVAFDLHKWMYMPYEIGCVLIKNKDSHRGSFYIQPSYLVSHEKGLAAGPDPVNNYGLELSRGFKALKVWMSIKEHGIDAFKDLIAQNIAHSFYLGELVKSSEHLELLTPVTMNIVCFRFVLEGLSTEELNELNKNILMTLQERGIASPSSTVLSGKYAIRCANVNHRSRKEDFDMLVTAAIAIGKELSFKE